LNLYKSGLTAREVYKELGEKSSIRSFSRLISRWMRMAGVSHKYNFHRWDKISKEVKNE